MLRAAKRPVLLPGTGVRIAGAHDLFLKVADRLGIAIAPAWNAQDVVADDHPLYVGRPGTVGDRAGNFAVQKSDLLLVLGCRLNVRQISYNFAAFAPDAAKIMVDVDAGELAKPTISIDLPIHADLKDFLTVLLDELDGYDNSARPRRLCRMGPAAPPPIPRLAARILGHQGRGEPLLLRRDLVRRTGRG